MTPETLIAFLFFLTIFGLGGLGFWIYTNRKYSNDRFDTTANFLDSLEERTVHLSNAMEGRIEELRKQIQTLDSRHSEDQKSFSESQTQNLQQLADIFQSIQSIKDSQTKDKEEFSHHLEEIRNRIESLTQSIQQQIERLDRHEIVVSQVHHRNEIHIARMSLAEGKCLEAVQSLTTLLENRPDDLEVRLCLSKAFLGLNELSQCRSVLLEGLEYHPDDSSLTAELAYLSYLEKNYAEQARWVTTGLVRNPQHPRLLFVRGLLNMACARYQEAVEDFRQVLSLGVETAEVRYNLGMAYVAEGNVPMAVLELRRSLALDPVSADSNHALGLALMHGQRALEAVDFLERAREILPNNVSIRCDLAAAYRLSRVPDKALRECAIAIQLNPQVPRIYMEQALAYHLQADYNSALETLDQLIDMVPQSLDAHRLKAEILMELERYEEAVQEWEILGQLAPDDPNMQVSLGETLKKAGQPVAALGCLEIASRLAPESMWIQISLAREALVQKKFDLALDVIDQAFPRAKTGAEKLQLIELKLLVALASKKWIQLDGILRDLKSTLEHHPEVLPMDQICEISGDDLLKLNLDRESTRVHNGLLDLYKGIIDLPDLDEMVTRLMRSILVSIQTTPPAESPSEPPSAPTPDMVEEVLPEEAPQTIIPQPLLIPEVEVEPEKIAEPIPGNVSAGSIPPQESEQVEDIHSGILPHEEKKDPGSDHRPKKKKSKHK